MRDASKSRSPERAARWRRRWGRIAAALAVSGFALCRPAAAEPSFERSFRSLLEEGQAPGSYRLGMHLPGATEFRTEDLRSAAEAAAAETPKPRKLWIGVVSLATLVGSAYNSFGDGPSQSFHFTNEGWFGRNTFTGGADKASHFVSYNVVARLLTEVYGDLGVSTDGSRLLGAGVSTLAGLVTEIGDGTNRYGFSYEDLVFDVFGAATALATAHYGLDDLIGFRAGLVPAPDVVDPTEEGFGKDYTQEIYTGDLKIAGLAKRLHFRPGPARFLLLSATYGVKGYPYAAADVRERQIGIEIGLHLTEILRAVGVPNNKWWLRVLFVILDSIRFPYTSVGFQFDVNHKKWRGPGIGDSFAAGRN
jgi:Predicted periplasmic lipoprotein (DUF2279)